MKRPTNFGSRKPAKVAEKRHGKNARRLLVVVALIAVLTVVVKQIIADSLTTLRESTRTAEARFSTQSDPSAISMQVFNLQQQAEQLKAESIASAPGTTKDFSFLILQARAETAQVKAGLNADFDSLSKLLDALPPGAKALRGELPKVKSAVDSADISAQTIMNSGSTGDAEEYARIKMAMAMYLVAELPVIVLGDATVTYAEKIESAADSVLRLCNRVFYFLVAPGVLLGLYAAVLQLKAQSD